MKRLLVLAVALVPLGISTAAGAQTSNSGALTLGVQQVGTDSMVLQDRDRMTNVANQMNHEEPPSTEQNASTTAPPQQRQTRTPVLPEDMVVRSSSFGGVSVGVEF